MGNNCNSCQYANDQQTTDGGMIESFRNQPFIPMPKDQIGFTDIDLSADSHVPNEQWVCFQEPPIEKINLRQSIQFPHSNKAYEFKDFVYVGQWKDFKPYGLGTFYFKDGNIYNGISENMLPHKMGRKYYKDGTIYEGEFYMGKKQGKGRYISQSQNMIYEGVWIDDLPVHGTETWNDTMQYVGKYQNGKKNGKGKITWKCKFYEGEFKDDEFEGYGVYQFEDGRVYQGHWKKNKMSGVGVMKWPNGDYYEGQFENDQKHGYGLFCIGGIKLTVHCRFGSLLDN